MSLHIMSNSWFSFQDMLKIVSLFNGLPPEDKRATVAALSVYD
jgi:hypothetical protein